jgi:hypothetical protein
MVVAAAGPIPGISSSRVAARGERSRLRLDPGIDLADVILDRFDPSSAATAGEGWGVRPTS